MKILYCLLLLSVTVPGITFSQETREAEFLNPEDLGARKFILEAKPEHGQVVVLRSETFVDDVLVDKHDNIYYSVSLDNQTKAQSHSVLLINRSFFTEQKTHTSEKYVLTYPGGRRNIDSKRLQSWGSGGNEVSLVFISNLSTDGGQKEKFLFSIFVEDYEVVKERIPDLPAIETGKGWGFGYSYNIETE